MSLWNKPLSEIGFADIDEFCSAGIAEGTRLDYKGAIPKDLAKLVAAFGNTMGGLIIVGVDANKTTNQPILPLVGMPTEKGLSEKILQICRDGIYPSLLPEISPIIEHPNNPQNVFVVVRVPESPEAPHAVNNKTHVYVRTGDVGRPVHFADVDRIAYFLARRSSAEQSREAEIERSLQRAQRLFARYPRVPIFWSAVTPVFAWRNLCTMEQAKAFHRMHGGDQCQSAPFGTIGRVLKRPWRPYVDLDRTLHDTEPRPEELTELKSLTVRGHVFGAMRVLPDATADRSIYLSFQDGVIWFRDVLQFARQFYERHVAERPGYLQLTIGAQQVALLQMLITEMHGFTRAGPPFPDERFRSDVVVQTSELLSAKLNGDVPGDLERELYREFAAAFDHPIKHGW